MWLVFVKNFWTRITSVFFLGRHYHRICHQLNIYGMNSADLFATVKIHRKHLCKCGTASHKHLSNDWLVLWVGDAKLSLLQKVVTHVAEISQTSLLHDTFCLSMICSDNDIEILWIFPYLFLHMNLNYTIFVDFFLYAKQYWVSNPCIVSFVD